MYDGQKRVNSTMFLNPHTNMMVNKELNSVPVSIVRLTCKT